MWKVRLDAGPAVVKEFVGGVDAQRRFAREVAALRLAAAADPAVAPRLLGVDPAAQVLVLEHLTREPAAKDWAVAYARALAGLHATAGDSPDLGRWSGPTAADIASFLRLAADLGAGVPPGAAEELSRSVAWVAGWPRDALLHGDPCPDNEVHTSMGMRFVDFERGALGPGLVELAYLRMAFPTCWCAARLPEPDLVAAEGAYVEVWQAATGRPLVGFIGDACVAWLIRGDSLVEMALRDGTDHLAAAAYADWKWGTATARQRLKHRLGVVAGVTDGCADLSEVHGLTMSMTRQIETRWPGLAPLPGLSTVRI
ncbi:MAG: aminoglycoside phosphotransferase family protein [Actinomycetota bacterium]|nr:aminoglycoside phosphotransferase family protein [Actinomycetota bacterium]